MKMSENVRNLQPLHVAFTATPEIFATDSNGAFVYPLTHAQGARLDTLRYDEMRFVVSVWHPREGKNIDLDKAYLELRANFTEDGHWTRLAELEPGRVALPAGRDVRRLDRSAGALR